MADTGLDLSGGGGWLASMCAIRAAWSANGSASRVLALRCDTTLGLTGSSSSLSVAAGFVWRDSRCAAVSSASNGLGTSVSVAQHAAGEWVLSGSTS